jgi:Na+/proline symporter
MILLSHVVIALVSLLYTGYAYLSPTNQKLLVSYAFVGLTIASGSMLVFQNQASLLHACISGLFFLGLEFLGIALVQRKLAAELLVVKSSHRD